MGTAIGALAGAGTRPAIQSLRRMAKTPAVQNAIWSRVENALSEAPASTEQSLTRNLAMAELLRRSPRLRLELLPLAAEEKDQ